MSGAMQRAARLSRPLDFLVVTDHAEGLGIGYRVHEGDPAFASDATLARWAKMLKEGGQAAADATNELIKTAGAGKLRPVLKDPKVVGPVVKSVWNKYTATAEAFDQPGRFTAMIGYEWSSAPDGNNLHRNVMFRDGKDKADQVWASVLPTKPNLNGFAPSFCSSSSPGPSASRSPGPSGSRSPGPSGPGITPGQGRQGPREGPRRRLGRRGQAQGQGGGKLASVGDTVDVSTATWTNTIGDPELSAVWTDPDFDPTVRAFYDARVIEIPTPRWTAYDAARFGITLPPEVPLTVQERAWVSPIWHTPRWSGHRP